MNNKIYSKHNTIYTTVTVSIRRQCIGGYHTYSDYEFSIDKAKPIEVTIELPSYSCLDATFDEKMELKNKEEAEHYAVCCVRQLYDSIINEIKNE